MKIFFVLLIGLVLIGAVGGFITHMREPAGPVEKTSCEQNQYKIEGHSLHGLVENGDSVQAFDVACAGPIGRHDLVIFQTGAASKPIIKEVRAVAGDRFAVRNGNIILNDDILTTPSGEPFRLLPQRTRMLDLYARSYDGLMPPMTLLVLGTLAEGTLDSTHFGLIHTDDVLFVVPAKNRNH